MIEEVSEEIIEKNEEIQSSENIIEEVIQEEKIEETLIENNIVEPKIETPKPEVKKDRVINTKSNDFGKIILKPK